MKLREPHIETTLRHLLWAADEARRGKLPAKLRHAIGAALCEAWGYRDLAARRKRKGK